MWGAEGRGIAVDDEVAALTKRLRGHRVWRGVNRCWYVWQMRTSPPKVTSYPARDELVAELRERVRQQDRWDARNR